MKSIKTKISIFILFHQPKAQTRPITLRCILFIFYFILSKYFSSFFVHKHKMSNFKKKKKKTYHPNILYRIVEQTI